MIRKLLHALPSSLEQPLRSFLRRAKYAGWSRSCPVCRSFVREFLPAGVVPRPDAVCPVCESYERHRLLWVFLQRHTDLFSARAKRVLHVAPEPILESRLRRLPAVDYLSADLHNPDAMIEMDITNISLEDGSFDVILCSHVLEHVPDDGKAMRELFRVLRPGGWAVLQVPIRGPRTVEDPSLTDPVERERLFGQRDHVRYYGADYGDRLREAGFRVRTFPAGEVVGQENVTRMGIMADEDVYYCTRG